MNEFLIPYAYSNLPDSVKDSLLQVAEDRLGKGELVTFGKREFNDFTRLKRFLYGLFPEEGKVVRFRRYPHP